MHVSDSKLVGFPFLEKQHISYPKYTKSQKIEFLTCNRRN